MGHEPNLGRFVFPSDAPTLAISGLATEQVIRISGSAQPPLLLSHFFDDQVLIEVEE
jgi:hypothetical protein